MRTFSAVIFIVLFSISCTKPDVISEVESMPGAAGGPKPPSTTTSILKAQKSLGSTVSDHGWSVVNTSDGGYIFAATTYGGSNGDVTINQQSNGGDDAWIVKLRSDFSIEWSRPFGGSNRDVAYSIVEVIDGYVFVGFTESNDGDFADAGNRGGKDLAVGKLDKSGNKLWVKLYGGTGAESGDAILKTSDGFIVVGNTNSPVSGDVTHSYGLKDVWILRLDMEGSLLWQKSYGGSGDEGSYFNSIADVDGSSFIINAKSNSTGGGNFIGPNKGGDDCWLFQINGTDGALLWQKNYGGSAGEGAGTIFKVADGFVFSANSFSKDGNLTTNKGSLDAWVVKINSSGSIVWQKSFGGSDVDHLRVFDVSTSGEIFLTGYSFSRSGKTSDLPGNKGGSDLWVLKLDANGNKLSSHTLGSSRDDSGEWVVPIGSNQFVSVGKCGANDGDVTGNHGLLDVWMVRYQL